MRTNIKKEKGEKTYIHVRQCLRVENTMKNDDCSLCYFFLSSRSFDPVIFVFKKAKHSIIVIGEKTSLRGQTDKKVLSIENRDWRHITKG